MFSTADWYLLGCFGVLFVVLSMWIRAIGIYARNAVHYIETQNKRSVSLAKIAEVESSLTELLDSYDSLLKSHKKLRSRIGMREVREKRKLEDDPPMSTEGKEQWKREMRLKLRQSGALK